MSTNSNHFSETLSKLTKVTWDGYFQFQQQWLEMIGVMKRQDCGSGVEVAGQQLFKTWMEIYEKEFKKFVGAPQLGLTRFYQERIREVLDKFNLFQAKMGEFTLFLSVPIEKSFNLMRERLEELTKGGKLPENPKEYYQIWIKILEEYYLNLLKSSEYIQVMNDTLNALEEFTQARQKVFQLFLQIFSVPSYTDLDDISKELYELKKRVKEIARKVEP